MSSQADESATKVVAPQQAVQLQHSSSSSNASSISSSSLSAPSAVTGSNSSLSAQQPLPSTSSHSHNPSLSVSSSSNSSSAASVSRSRSNSESMFKSSRAEKRMGRLFKPTSTSTSSNSSQNATTNSSTPVDGSVSSNSTLTNAVSSPEELSASKVDISNTSNLTASTASSSNTVINGNGQANSLPSQQPPPPPLIKQTTSYFPPQLTQQQQHQSHLHTQSQTHTPTQLASQHQTETQTETELPIQTQTQLHKPQQSLELEDIKTHLSKNLRSGANGAYMSPPISLQSAHSATSSASSSTSNDLDNMHRITNNSGNNRIISPSNTGGLGLPAFPQRKSSVTGSHMASSERSKLASVDEVDTKPKRSISKLEFNTLIQLSHKLKNVYMEILRLAKHSNCTGYSTLSSVNTLEKLEGDMNTFTTSDSRGVLLTTMGSFCKVLAKLLNTCFSKINEDYQVSMVRMLYMSFTSIMVELAEVCNIVEPKSTDVFSQPPRKSSLPALHQSNLLLTSSKSMLHLNNTNPSTQAQSKIRSQQVLKVKRSPAPLTQGQLSNIPSFSRQLSTSGSLSNSSTSLANSKQAAVPLKIDTTNLLNRQDSEIETPLHTSIYHNSQNEEDKLYDLIAYTAQAAQVVFSQLNDAIFKSAVVSAQNASKQQSGDGGTSNGAVDESISPSSISHNPPEQQQFEANNNIAHKVKELTTYCVVSMDQTKKIKSILSIIRTVQVPNEDQQRQLYDETNMFLKSIIGILAATKGAITDLPQLNEVRGALSTLTRATKELTIKLEASTLKTSVVNSSNAAMAAVENQPPSLSAIPSVSNFTVHSQQQQQFQQQQQQFTSPTTVTNIPSTSGLSIGNVTSTPLYMPLRTRSTSVSADDSTTSTNDTFSSLQPVSESSMESAEHLNMKQHIRNLNLQHLEPPALTSTPTSLSVTTPLVASIGPAAASAVLPVVSPLGNQTPPMTMLTGTYGNNGSALSGNPAGSGVATGGENPFDKIVFPNSNTSAPE